MDRETTFEAERGALDDTTAHDLTSFGGDAPGRAPAPQSPVMAWNEWTRWKR